LGCLAAEFQFVTQAAIEVAMFLFTFKNQGMEN